MSKKAMMSDDNLFDKVASELERKDTDPKMDKELVDRIVSEVRKERGEVGFDEYLVRTTISKIEELKLTRRSESTPRKISESDKKHLEDIRDRDIQRRVAEKNGIIGGMREHFNIAFLLNYIDKLEGREP